jgi:chromosomal replication initiator protein
MIILAVAETFGISVEDLKGTSRRRDISNARQVGMFLMRQHTGLSLPKIGEEFGGKDHTTVLYSCEKVSDLQKTDPNIAQSLRQLRDRLANHQAK